MAKREKAAALDAALKKMFRTIETRPAPHPLRAVVEQLDARAEAPLRKAS